MSYCWISQEFAQYLCSCCRRRVLIPSHKISSCCALDLTIKLCGKENKELMKSKDGESGDLDHQFGTISRSRDLLQWRVCTADTVSNCQHKTIPSVKSTSNIHQLNHWAFHPVYGIRPRLRAYPDSRHS